MRIPRWAWYVIIAVIAYVLYTRYVAVKIKAQKVTAK